MSRAYYGGGLAEREDFNTPQDRNTWYSFEDVEYPFERNQDRDRPSMDREERNWMLTDDSSYWTGQRPAEDIQDQFDDDMSRIRSTNITFFLYPYTYRNSEWFSWS